nr:LEPR-XLL domain-containing protein [Methylorubrum extorquens]
MAVEKPRPSRPSKRQLVLHLKTKAGKLFNRDRLIFDPLEPRVLLNSDITYQIGAPSDAATVEHQLLVKLIEQNETINSATKAVQRIQVFDYTNGTQGTNPLHTFGIIDANSNQAYTLQGSGGKETITVDADSFKLLGATQKPILAFTDPTSPGNNLDNTLALLNTPTGSTQSGAEFKLTGANAGEIASGKFAGSFSDVANLVGAASADDKLTIGANGSLSGTFGGGKKSLQLDISSVVAGSIDATLSGGGSSYTLARTSGSSAATFGSLAFTAPTTSLGVILGSGDDTLHLASLPPAPSFSVSGGAGADRIVFDTDLSAASGNLAVTFDGGAGNDSIAVSANLTAMAGDLGIVFKGGEGANTLSVASGKTLSASGQVTIAADATVTPVLTTSGFDRSGSATAQMAVTVNDGAVIRGTGVRVAVRSDIAIADIAPADTSTISVTANGLAGITLAGTVDAGTGDAVLTTDVNNAVTLTSTLTSQLKSVAPKQTNSSTIAVGAKGGGERRDREDRRQHGGQGRCEGHRARSARPPDSDRRRGRHLRQGQERDQGRGQLQRHLHTRRTGRQGPDQIGRNDDQQHDAGDGRSECGEHRSADQADRRRHPCRQRSCPRASDLGRRQDRLDDHARRAGCCVGAGVPVR